MDAGSSITYFTVTSAMMEPIVNAVNSALTVVTPIGVTVLASFIGINAVKRLIYTFI